MSRHARRKAPRPVGARSVALIAAVCAFGTAGGFTAATWLSGDDVDPVQVHTGHLEVQVLRDLPGDVDGDGVRWWVADDAVDPATWEGIDAGRPVVFPGDLVVATVTFRVGLEGHNLLADLRLHSDGDPIMATGDLDGFLEQGAGVLPGTADGGAAYAALEDESSPGWLSAPTTIMLPAQTQAEDTKTYTLAALFRVDAGDGTDGSPDLDGLTAGLPRLEVVLEQARDAEASARSEGGA